jgi:hypothetical protein
LVRMLLGKQDVEESGLATLKCEIYGLGLWGR